MKKKKIFKILEKNFFEPPIIINKKIFPEKFLKKMTIFWKILKSLENIFLNHQSDLPINMVDGCWIYPPSGKHGRSVGRFFKFGKLNLLGVCLSSYGYHVNRWLRWHLCKNNPWQIFHGVLYFWWSGDVCQLRTGNYWTYGKPEKIWRFV